MIPRNWSWLGIDTLHFDDIMTLSLSKGCCFEVVLMVGELANEMATDCSSGRQPAGGSVCRLTLTLLWHSAVRPAAAVSKFERWNVTKEMRLDKGVIHPQSQRPKRLVRFSRVPLMHQVRSIAAKSMHRKPNLHLGVEHQGINQPCSPYGYESTIQFTPGYGSTI